MRRAHVDFVVLLVMAAAGIASLCVLPQGTLQRTVAVLAAVLGVVAGWRARAYLRRPHSQRAQLLSLVPTIGFVVLLGVLPTVVVIGIVGASVGGLVACCCVVGWPRMRLAA